MNEQEQRPDHPLSHGERRLARFHDGELGPAEAAEVERQLGDGPDGAATLEWYRRLGDAFRFGMPAGAPVGLQDAVMRRIRAGRRSDDHPLVSLLPVMRRLAVAAALLVAVTGAGFWLQRGKAEGPHGSRQLVSVERSESLGQVTLEVRAPARGRLLR